VDRADLIVLAGQVALESAGAPAMTFCGGRTDAADGDGSTFLSQTLTGDASTDTSATMSEAISLMGLSEREFVVLMGGGHSLGTKHESRSGYSGAWTADPTVLSNQYFKTLLDKSWDEVTVTSSGKRQYKASDAELYMLTTDMMLSADPRLASHVHEFALDNELFLNEFAAAWTKLVEADRFDGSFQLCDVD
jgi:catalase (peroxidase I)